MLAKGLLDRSQLGLHLDNQQDPSRRVPGEDVDRATFPVHREGHFEADLPPQLPQRGGNQPDERRMSFIHEAIQVTSAPSKPDRKVRLESCGDTTKPADWHRVNSPALHSRYVVLCDAGALGKILLSPPKALPQCSKLRPEPDIIHGRSMVTGQPYPAITYAPHACYPRIRVWIGLRAGPSAAS
jgi:hypothetical protein